jgi:hypothetical protein
VVGRWWSDGRYKQARIWSLVQIPKIAKNGDKNNDRRSVEDGDTWKVCGVFRRR